MEYRMPGFWAGLCGESHTYRVRTAGGTEFMWLQTGPPLCFLEEIILGLVSNLHAPQ